MIFTNITSQEFKEFALNHPLNNFYQTVAWGELKKENGWDPHFVAVKDENGNILGGAMLLQKNLILNKKLFYSPRGYLVDFNNKELLEFFIVELKKYSIKHNCVFVKIDPYLVHLERDSEAKVVENGIDNSEIIKVLKSFGFYHNGLNTENNIQPRWISVLNIDSKDSKQLLNEMSPTTRKIIRRNIKIGIRCRDGNESDMELFKEIMKYTSKRKQFLDRPLEYYQRMYKHLDKDNMIKLRITELHPQIAIDGFNEEKTQIEKRVKKRNQKLQSGEGRVNVENLTKKNELDYKELDRINNKIEEFTNLLNEEGEVIPLGAAIYIVYGDEVLALFAGAFDKYMKFSSAYSTYWNMVDYASKNNFKKLNFYGINGDFSEDSPGIGLYLIKKSFGCRVVELVGEFDLIVDKFFYIAYKYGFKIFKKLKNFKSVYLSR